MKRFLSLLALYSIPFLLAWGIYMAFDPFKVIWHYDNFLPTGEYATTLDMDYVSTTNYGHLNPQQHYNAFIFGNSRSRCWKVDSWRQHLDGDAVCYHFDAHGETLLGIDRKVGYIDRMGERLDHVLMVIDASVLRETEIVRTHIRYLAPQLADWPDAVGFHVCNFKSFYTPRFTKAYLDFKLSGHVKPYMIENEIFTRNDHYDPISNEYLPLTSEQKIATGTFYDGERMKMFEGQQFPDSVSPPLIAAKQLEMLEHMAGVFARHHTDVKIAISPLFNQIRLNPSDLVKLREIFGADKVFDFSGVNDITSDFHHYYEESHYRIHIADSLFNVIYQ